MEQTWLQWWFCCPKYTAMAQVIVAFTWGMLLSPWSNGIFWLALFIILYELLFYAFTQGQKKYYNLFVRTGVICATVLGYLCGQTLAQGEIMYSSVPKFCDEPGDC